MSSHTSNWDQKVQQDLKLELKLELNNTALRLYCAMWQLMVWPNSFAGDAAAPSSSRHVVECVAKLDNMYSDGQAFIGGI